MLSGKLSRREKESRRHMRVRRKIKGTPERPRLCIFKSLNNIYGQIIDDVNGNTLTAASTLSSELKGELNNGANMEAAAKVGELIAKKALEKGIEEVVFDRGGYIYHGKVQAFADAAREAGLRF